jgi:hydroxymethylpyrimidine pyrophosphatase-like HAD family hydrolase
MPKTFAFDLDGTLCEERKAFEKSLAQPITQMIEMANALYDQGNTIIIFTARGWQEYVMTEHWLKTHKVKYHLLLCGKPIYDHIIDDRAINAQNLADVKLLLRKD